MHISTFQETGETNNTIPFANKKLVSRRLNTLPQVIKSIDSDRIQNHMFLTCKSKREIPVNQDNQEKFNDQFDCGLVEEILEVI